MRNFENNKKKVEEKLMRNKNQLFFSIQVLNQIFCNYKMPITQ